VLVNWKRAAGEADFNYKADQLIASTNMVDFDPVFLQNRTTPASYISAPAGCNGYLCIGTTVKAQPILNTAELPALADTADGVKNYGTSVAPDFYEMPPDDIWTQCGIQFQVVAQYEATLPANWQNHCYANSSNVPDPFMNVAALHNNPWLMQLAPIAVSFVDDQTAGCPWWGMTVGIGGNRIEIDHQHGGGHGATTTAHELGHALGLNHLAVSGNLMASNGPNGGPGGAGWQAVTAAQCTAARTAAAALSSRYDYYNYLIGRTYSSTPPPAAPAGANDDGGFNPGNGGGGPLQSCTVAADCGYGYQCQSNTCVKIPH